jgi:hypothetical protein
MDGLEITRRRMAGSRLTGRPFDAPDEAVRRHGAMQAQDYGPAKWSVGQRVPSLVDEDLDRALAAGTILRTHVLRPTWHFVARDDIRWLLALTGPRVQRHNGPRYRELGLDERTRARSLTVIASALEGGNHMTRDALGVVLDHAGIDRSGQRLPYLLMHCELEAAICSGGLEGRRHTYALLDERVPGDGRFDHDEALVELARRYLTSHGPATVQDLRWWSSLTAADVTRAMRMMGPDVQRESIDAVTFWSTASDAGPPPSGRTAQLIQAYDELVVGYTVSRWFGDPGAAVARAAWRDRSLPNGVVLLNGGVAGRWRRTIGKESVRVEALTYEDPAPSTVRALGAAAKRLARFLGRRVTVEARRL